MRDRLVVYGAHVVFWGILGGIAIWAPTQLRLSYSILWAVVVGLWALLVITLHKRNKYRKVARRDHSELFSDKRSRNPLAVGDDSLKTTLNDPES
jgi:hypothetical protein